MECSTPVCIFVFKRSDLVERLLRRLRSVRPTRLYVCCDGPRNAIEEPEVAAVRDTVAREIDWPCEVIKRYQSSNVGVLANLAGNMISILQVEEQVIFLEEDNLPATSFFAYCELMLSKYNDADQVVWICGTNYLNRFPSKVKSDVAFSQHHFPCGFATWSHKFLAVYDASLTHLDRDKKKFIGSFNSKILAYQEWVSQKKTEFLYREARQRCSWDRQMQFAIRTHDLYGVIPRENLIENTGVDERSTHGGSSLDLKMTRKFCGMTAGDLEIKRLPTEIALDASIEREFERFFHKPFVSNVKILCALLLRWMLRQPLYKPNFL